MLHFAWTLEDLLMNACLVLSMLKGEQIVDDGCVNRLEAEQALN
jgi:hypothetical protein